MRRELVGREQELAAIDSFLAATGSARALLLEGGPGVGKTRLWQAGVDTAAAAGLYVLAARPSGAEATMSFAALTDLLERVDLSRLPRVPAPQRHALEVVLLREPTRGTVEPRAVATALLSTLRELASTRRLVVAVDDIQWLDGPSADALVFAARRLAGVDAMFLLAKRAGPGTQVERALSPALERMTVGPLSLGAIRKLLFERFDLSLPRRVLHRIYQASEGNPLFALELGRTVIERGLPAFGEELPVPDEVEDLLGVRVGSLTPPVRRFLLALALGGNLRVEDAEKLFSAEILDAALAADVAVVHRDRLRPSHPLLAETALAQSPPADRLAVHGDLAAVSPDETLRVRHLAMATASPDEALAARVHSAAEDAAARGSSHEAALLAEQALRLTPTGSLERPHRVVWLASYLAVAGEQEGVTELLSRELDSLPPGALRAHAWLIMPGGVVRGNDDVQRYLENALAESRDSPPLRAAVLGNLTTNAVMVRLERIAEAATWADEGLEIISGQDPKIERSLLYALAWARAVRGEAIDDLLERFAGMSSAAAYVLSSPARVQGLRHMWRGEIANAEAAFRELQALAEERGEAGSYAAARYHLCELALRRGHWPEATRLLDEWDDPIERQLIPWPAYECCRALLAAGIGAADEAREWGEQSVRLAREHGGAFQELNGRRALGLAALLAHDPATAADALRGVWEHAAREGVDEPGALPVAPDLVEALAELGELAEALAVTDRLRRLSVEQEHPWGLAASQACAGLVDLAAERYEPGAEALVAAAGLYEKLGLRFDAARALLALGRVARRSRKWGAARRALEPALATFEDLGSRGWAAAAEEQLARVGARRPKPAGELTPTEERVAELAAGGLSNKEIAAALVVSVYTVEGHLSKIYAKLGIRSRTQLAARLGSAPG